MKLPDEPDDKQKPKTPGELPEEVPDPGLAGALNQGREVADLTARLKHANNELEQKTAELQEITRRLQQITDLRKHSRQSPDHHSPEVQALKELEDQQKPMPIRTSDQWERTLDTIPDFVAILDNDNRITWINHAMAMRLGREPGEVVGLPCYFVLHGSDAPPPYCPHLKALSQGHEEIVEVREEQTGRHFLVSYTPLTTPDGAVTGMVHVARDITERKRAEQEIARLNADLAARAAQLEALNKDLEAFNYTVAHDLRRPLNVIYGHAQSIEYHCGKKLDDACREDLRATYTGIRHMSRLIDCLLNFSRLNQVEIRKEKVDLSALAHTVSKELHESEPQRSVTFRIAEGVTVEGDNDLLRIVLDNLLGNAWKYSAQREHAVIEFGTAALCGQTACFVRDNGAGFDMATAGRIFSPFTRLEGADAGGGFGVGLATVERIIRRHGGRVWADSEPGKGATFYFTLFSS